MHDAHCMEIMIGIHSLLSCFQNTPEASTWLCAPEADLKAPASQKKHSVTTMDEDASVWVGLFEDKCLLDRDPDVAEASCPRSFRFCVDNLLGKGIPWNNLADRPAHLGHVGRSNSAIRSAA